jgi:hypothetical protein
VKSGRPQNTSAVLIAPAEWLAQLQQQHGLAGADAFLDTDVETALESVIRQRPRIIAMEADFAASPHGVAFLSRVQAELELGKYEVRLLRTRRAPRFTPARGVEVVVDGHPAVLIDISVNGAQMIASSRLKPNQRVRISLNPEKPIRFNGSVAWAAFELAPEGPRYRVGVVFKDAVPEMVTRFIESMIR